MDLEQECQHAVQFLRWQKDLSDKTFINHMVSRWVAWRKRIITDTAYSLAQLRRIREADLREMSEQLGAVILDYGLPWEVPGDEDPLGDHVDFCSFALAILWWIIVKEPSLAEMSYENWIKRFSSWWMENQVLNQPVVYEQGALL